MSSSVVNASCPASLWKCLVQSPSKHLLHAWCLPTSPDVAWSIRRRAAFQTLCHWKCTWRHSPSCAGTARSAGTRVNGRQTDARQSTCLSSNDSWGRDVRCAALEFFATGIQRRMDNFTLGRFVTRPSGDNFVRKKRRVNTKPYLAYGIRESKAGQDQGGLQVTTPEWKKKKKTYCSASSQARLQFAVARWPGPRVQVLFSTSHEQSLPHISQHLTIGPFVVAGVTPLSKWNHPAPEPRARCLILLT